MEFIQCSLHCYRPSMHNTQWQMSYSCKWRHATTHYLRLFGRYMPENPTRWPVAAAWTCSRFSRWLHSDLPWHCSNLVLTAVISNFDIVRCAMHFGLVCDAKHANWRWQSYADFHIHIIYAIRQTAMIDCSNVFDLLSLSTWLRNNFMVFLFQLECHLIVFIK